MLALAALSACRGDGEAALPSSTGGDDAVPGLRPVRTQELQETDAIFVGKPVSLSIGPDGSYYVADGIQNRIVRFARSGEILAVYGRQGNGPGELLAPARTALLGDSLLLVQDLRRGRTIAFDIASQAHRFDVRFEGMPGSITTRGDTVWMGIENAQRQTGVAMWSGVDHDPSYLVGNPETYRASRLVAQRYSYVEVLPLEDRLLVSFLGSPDILLTDRSGRVLESFQVPVVRRRGIPDQLERRYIEARTPEAQFRLSSMLFGSHRLSSGAIVLVNMDQELRNRVPLRTGFVTVVRPNFSTACIDLPLRFSQDGMAAVSFRGDTLVTVEQVILEDRAKLLSREFVIDEAACRWQRMADDASSPRVQ